MWVLCGAIVPLQVVFRFRVFELIQRRKTTLANLTNLSLHGSLPLRVIHYRNKLVT